MICILSIENGEPKNWLLATDIDDARRTAYASGDYELSNLLYLMWEVAPGKHQLPTGQIMLVA